MLHSLVARARKTRMRYSSLLCFIHRPCGGLDLATFQFAQIVPSTQCCRCSNGNPNNVCGQTPSSDHWWRLFLCDCPEQSTAYKTVDLRGKVISKRSFPHGFKSTYIFLGVIRAVEPSTIALKFLLQCGSILPFNLPVRFEPNNFQNRFAHIVVPRKRPLRKRFSLRMRILDIVCEDNSII